MSEDAPLPDPPPPPPLEGEKAPLPAKLAGLQTALPQVRSERQSGKLLFAWRRTPLSSQYGLV